MKLTRSFYVVALGLCLAGAAHAAHDHHHGHEAEAPQKLQLNAGKKWDGYVKNLRKDGSHYWVHAVVVPNVRNGQIVGFTSVRRKPSRSKVDASAALYVDMKAKETA